MPQQTGNYCRYAQNDKRCPIRSGMTKVIRLGASARARTLDQCVHPQEVCVWYLVALGTTAGAYVNLGRKPIERKPLSAKGAAGAATLPTVTQKRPLMRRRWLMLANLGAKIAHNV